MDIQLGSFLLLLKPYDGYNPDSVKDNFDQVIKQPQSHENILKFVSHTLDQCFSTAVTRPGTGLEGLLTGNYFLKTHNFRNFILKKLLVILAK
jgi:hypothetical protein